MYQRMRMVCVADRIHIEIKAAYQKDDVVEDDACLRIVDYTSRPNRWCVSGERGEEPTKSHVHGKEFLAEVKKRGGSGIRVLTRFTKDEKSRWDGGFSRTRRRWGCA